MNWDEYKQHFKEEWAFYKRHPELLFMWLVYAFSIVYFIYKYKGTA
jgi:hypothetical protein